MPAAFPTAMGFGSLSVGGRNGAVYQVTRLDDNTSAPVPGMLRYGIQQSGPRTIVFRVGGTINLAGTLSVRNPYITIAGQTAPGQGIQLKNHSFVINTSNVICRFIRSRVGHDGITGLPTTGLNTVAINVLGYDGDGVVAAPRDHVIVDHCEGCWGNDSALDVYGNVTNVTIQNCIMSEGTFGQQGGNGTAHISGKLSLVASGMFTRIKQVSLLRNLYMHGDDRIPDVNNYVHNSVRQLNAQIDFRNNLVYNWINGSSETRWKSAYSSASVYTLYKNAFNSNPAANHVVQTNMVGNHFRSGPNTNTTSPAACWVTAMTRLHAMNNISPASAVPQDGFACIVHRTDCSVVGGFPPGYVSEHTSHNGFVTDPYRQDTPFDFYGSTYTVPTTLTATNVFETVLQNVGCQNVVRNGVPTLIRDSMTLRQTDDVRLLRGYTPLTLTQWQSGQRLSYPTISSGIPETDTNADGVPDAWAQANGFSVNTPLNTTFHSSGYTWLEVYINELAGDTPPISQPPDTTPPAVPTGFLVA